MTTNRTTARVNTHVFEFSKEDSAQEFLQYANSLPEVVSAAHPLMNSVPNSKKVVICGHPSMLLNLDLLGKLQRKSSILLMRERIARLRERAEACKEEKDMLSEFLLREADKLEKELKQM